MTKNKKMTYAAVLGLCGLAFLIERLTASPSSASAATTNERPLTALGVDAAPDATVSVAAAPFPKSPPLLTLGPARDVFAASERVREALMGSTQDPSGGGDANAQRGAAAIMTAEKFETDHRLTGTLIGQRGSFAIVDDRWLRVGDTLDDCELTSITGTGAKFQCPNDVASLSVIED